MCLQVDLIFYIYRHISEFQTEIRGIRIPKRSLFRAKISLFHFSFTHLSTCCCCCCCKEFFFANSLERLSNTRKWNKIKYWMWRGRGREREKKAERQIFITEIWLHSIFHSSLLFFILIYIYFLFCGFRWFSAIIFCQ